MDLSENKRRKLGTGFWGVEVPLHRPLSPYSREQGAPFSMDIYYQCFPLNIYDNTVTAGNLSPVWGWEWGRALTAGSCKLTCMYLESGFLFSFRSSGRMLSQRTVQRDGAAGREKLCHAYQSLELTWLWVTSLERSRMHPPVNLVHGNTAYRTGSAPGEFSSSWHGQQPYIMLAINVSNPCKCSVVFCFSWLLLAGTPFRDSSLTCSLN